MNETSYRADLFNLSEVNEKFVKSETDDNIINNLMGASPILIEGGRGTGKTLLMKVTESKLISSFEDDKILPVYISFRKTMMVDDIYLEQWMLATILGSIKRSLEKNLKIFSEEKKDIINSLFGIKSTTENPVMRKIDEFIELLESTWKNSSELNEKAKLILENNPQDIPIFSKIEGFINLCEYIVSELELKKIYLFFDEACHIFSGAQQNKFFDLFRDLTCDILVCKAAVYPGIANFGDNFQLSHDATLIKLTRKFTYENYDNFMIKVLEKNGIQFSKKILDSDSFLTLLYACSGNPRTLIKSILEITDQFEEKNLSFKKTNEFIKDYYRNSIWTDHTELIEKYTGHKGVLEWGRDYIEKEIRVKIRERNNSSDSTKGYSTEFSIDKDGTKTIQYALKLLEYSGIIVLDKDSIKKYSNHKNRIFRRYLLNLGILLSEETSPIIKCKEIISNHKTGQGIFQTTFPEVKFNLEDLEKFEANKKEIMENFRRKSINTLDITRWQKDKLIENNHTTIGNILDIKKEGLKEIHRIGDVRSNFIYDTALNAALEYIAM